MLRGETDVGIARFTKVIGGYGCDTLCHAVSLPATTFLLYLRVERSKDRYIGIGILV
jgi:hypothetical protein